MEGGGVAFFLFIRIRKFLLLGSEYFFGRYKYGILVLVVW